MKTMQKTPITDEKKGLALAMLEAGHSYREIGAALDISISSVHAISRQRPAESMVRLAEGIRSQFVVRHMMLAESLLESISDTDIMRASLKEKAIAAAILTDKAMKFEAMRAGRSNAREELKPLEPKAETEAQG